MAPSSLALVLLVLGFVTLSQQGSHCVGRRRPRCMQYSDSCQDVMNGEYALCRFCERGNYIRCARGKKTVKTCPLVKSSSKGLNGDFKGGLVQQVFVKRTRSCETPVHEGFCITSIDLFFPPPFRSTSKGEPEMPPVGSGESGESGGSSESGQDGGSSSSSESEEESVPTTTELPTETTTVAYVNTTTTELPTETTTEANAATTTTKLPVETTTVTYVTPTTTKLPADTTTVANAATTTSELPAETTTVKYVAPTTTKLPVETTTEANAATTTTELPVETTTAANATTTTSELPAETTTVTYAVPATTELPADTTTYTNAARLNDAISRRYLNYDEPEYVPPEYEISPGQSLYEGRGSLDMYYNMDMGEMLDEYMPVTPIPESLYEELESDSYFEAMRYYQDNVESGNEYQPPPNVYENNGLQQYYEDNDLDYTPSK